MAFVRYRDPDTGRFISRRSASLRTARPVSTETYSETNKRTAETPGYFKRFESLQRSELFDPGRSIGLSEDFIQGAITANPDITFEELIELADDLGIEFEMDLLEMDLMEDLDTDVELYKEK